MTDSGKKARSRVEIFYRIFIYFRVPTYFVLWILGPTVLFPRSDNLHPVDDWGSKAEIYNQTLLVSVLLNFFGLLLAITFTKKDPGPVPFFRRILIGLVPLAVWSAWLIYKANFIDVFYLGLMTTSIVLLSEGGLWLKNRRRSHPKNKGPA